MITVVTWLAVASLTSLILNPTLRVDRICQQKPGKKQMESFSSLKSGIEFIFEQLALYLFWTGQTSLTGNWGKLTSKTVFVNFLTDGACVRSNWQTFTEKENSLI